MYMIFFLFFGYGFASIFFSTIVAIIAGCVLYNYYIAANRPSKYIL